MFGLLNQESAMTTVTLPSSSVSSYALMRWMLTKSGTIKVRMKETYNFATSFAHDMNGAPRQT